MPFPTSAPPKPSFSLPSSLPISFIVCTTNFLLSIRPAILPLAFAFLLITNRFLLSAAVRCVNCQTVEEGELVCDDPCQGDICAIWSFREMSTDRTLQGCLSGADFREANGLRMGCRRNRVDALLCLCNSTDLCNMNERTVRLAQQPSEQPMLPSDLRCQSRTSAPFLRHQMVKPARHSCKSDLCFFSQSNTTTIRSEDPPPPSAVESTTSRNCGQQLEYNFDILLGPVWPGNGLHADGCYRLQTGRHSLLGCSCSNNDCNQEVPYPIGDRNPMVKCHLGTGSAFPFAQRKLVPSANSRVCQGHFCFVQKERLHGYGDYWTSGCLSTNESAARAQLRVGYRNILGVEQWLCASDFCSAEQQQQRNQQEAGEERERNRESTKSERRNNNGGRGRTKTGRGQAEGGRAQAMNKIRKELRQEGREEKGEAEGGGGGGADCCNSALSPLRTAARQREGRRGGRLMILPVAAGAILLLSPFLVH